MDRHDIKRHVLRAVDGPTTIYLSHVTDTIFDENTGTTTTSPTRTRIRQPSPRTNLRTPGQREPASGCAESFTLRCSRKSRSARGSRSETPPSPSSSRPAVASPGHRQHRTSPASLRSTSCPACWAARSMPICPPHQEVFATRAGAFWWSKVETFSGNLAQKMVLDALSAQNLNRFSVEARGSSKRSSFPE